MRDETSEQKPQIKIGLALKYVRLSLSCWERQCRD